MNQSQRHLILRREHITQTKFQYHANSNYYNSVVKLQIISYKTTFVHIIFYLPVFFLMKLWDFQNLVLTLQSKGLWLAGRLPPWEG